MAAALAPLVAGGKGGVSNKSAASLQNQTSRGSTILGNVDLGGLKFPKLETPVQYGILAIGAVGLVYYVLRGRK